MGGKIIPGLDPASYPALAENQYLAIHQENMLEAEKTPLAYYVPVDWDNAIAYIAGRQVWFEKQLFKILTATSAGQSPITNRNKFQWIGGGINIDNKASANPGTYFATLNHNSGYVYFSGLNVQPGDRTTIVINSTCFIPGTSGTGDVEVFIRNSADGQDLFIGSGSFVSLGNISVPILNPSDAQDAVTEFFMYFNDRM